MGIPRDFYLSHISLNGQESFLTLKQRPILNHKNFEKSINTVVIPIKISNLTLSSDNRKIDFSNGAFGVFEFLLEFNILQEEELKLQNLMYYLEEDHFQKNI